MRKSLLVLLFASASTSFSAGCAVPADGDDGDLDDPVASGSNAVVAPVCRLGPYRLQPFTTPLPRGEANVAAMQARVDAANARARQRGDDTRYTLESFGPYARFDVTLRGAADREVAVTVRIRHTLPNGKQLPPEDVWKGVIPAGVSGPIMFDAYYDAEKFGLGPDAPRFGLNHGWIEAECEGTVAKQAYAFIRR